MGLLENFINENYILPLCKYYTLPGTLTYGIILVLAVAGVYKLLQKLEIKIDKHFFYALLPFIIYGGWTRALRDHNLYEGWWWCSPPIYFLLFSIAFASLLIGVGLQRKFKFDYWKFMVLVGSAILAYNLTLTQITNFSALGMILGIWIIFMLAFFLISKKKPEWLSRINAGILSAHLLDGTSSFVAIQFYGYYEQHVLPGFLISIFGPWIMFPLKTIVVWGVLYLIDKEYKGKPESEQFFKNFLKIIIFILGAALGIRDMMTVGMLEV